MASSSSFSIPLVIEPLSLSPWATPWATFNQLWIFFKGYPAKEFRFEPGETLLSTWKETIAMIVVYLTVIFGGREIMRNRPAFKLQNLFVAHNLMLTIVSGVLLVLYAEQLIPTLWKHGIYENICGPHGWTPQLVVLYYLNYLTKYIELLDTVYLMLRKKPLTFLHCYHHPATALLCFTQLMGHTSISWIPITANLTVHVVMYWYFFQNALGIRIWWKELITRLQITQFFVDLGFVYFASYDFVATTQSWASSLPHTGHCNQYGTPAAAAWGDVILTSYLFLFISFYVTTYAKSTKQSRATLAMKAEEKMEKKEIPHLKETTDTANSALNAAMHKIQSLKS